MATTLVLGRDPASDINIADASVSRRHAELVLLDERRIFVRDLGASNGTAVIRAGSRIALQQGVVQEGDQVVFGDITIAFDELREMIRDTPAMRAAGPSPVPPPAPPPAPVPVPPRPDTPSWLEFIPLAGGGVGLMSNRALLIGGTLFAGLIARLFWLGSQFDTDPASASEFLVELSTAFALGAYVFVYRLAGRRKPWAMILVVMALEAGVMELHPVIGLPFCQATGARAVINRAHAARKAAAQGAQPQGAQAGSAPGESPGGGQQPGAGVKRAATAEGNAEPAGPPPEAPSFLALFLAYTTCVGLVEELDKMIPVFIVIMAAAYSVRPDVRRWGVFEPLDAIVYACAAALVFILVETLGSDSPYVGGQIAGVLAIYKTKLAEHPEAASQLAGLASQYIVGLLPMAMVRTLDALSGHLAYSGYFAYFVGLALLRPTQRERLLLGGWVSAAILHGFFDATVGSIVFETLSTFVAFFFLIAVILRARKTSPTRDENFATSGIPRSPAAQG